ncbi:MAG: BamA/TamA family outer membrane protein, partial [candidate division Zixibacteria bacterium]|nr:BamA/TamA family outer membrane protein [candidate division Zixibacteria bacterium]
MRFHILWLSLLLLFCGNLLSYDRATLRWMRRTPPPRITSIVIEGNSYLKDAEIKKQLYSRTESFWNIIKGDRRRMLQRETLRRDTLEVKYLYFINGFLNVKVNETFEVVERDSTCRVRINIDEGRQFFYGDKKVTGNYEGRFEYRFYNYAEKLKKGKPVNPFEIRQAVFEMEKVLANNGYPYAQITFEVDTSAGLHLSPITFEIQSDSLVHFGEVTIEGVKRYPEYVARRELKIKPGKIYRLDDVVRSQQRLFESGYFSTLQLNRAENSSDRLQPNFNLKLRERKTLYVTFKMGAGQSLDRDLVWSLSNNFGKRNLFGSRRVDLLSDYSFDIGQRTRLITHRYRLRFTEPWFIGFRMPLILTGEWEPKMYEPDERYKIGTWSITAATTKNFGQQVKTTLGFQYESVSISGLTPEEEIDIKQAEGISIRRKIYFTFRRDSRDNIFIPRKGSLFDLNGEYYGGFLHGDDNFYKIQTSWARYQTVWPGWISATRLGGGWADNFGASDDIPVDDRFSLGGANSVRGFRERYLGPLTEAGVPKGSKYFILFNHEFRWKTVQVFSVIPLLKDLFKSLPLWQSVFFDVGNGFETL